MLITIKRMIDSIAVARSHYPFKKTVCGFGEGEERKEFVLYFHRKAARKLETIIDFYENKAKQVVLRSPSSFPYTEDERPPGYFEMETTFIRHDDANKLFAQYIGEDSPECREAKRIAYMEGKIEAGDENGYYMWPRKDRAQTNNGEASAGTPTELDLSQKTG